MLSSSVTFVFYFCFSVFTLISAAALRDLLSFKMVFEQEQSEFLCYLCFCEFFPLNHALLVSDKYHKIRPILPETPRWTTSLPSWGTLRYFFADTRSFKAFGDVMMSSIDVIKFRYIKWFRDIIVCLSTLEPKFKGAPLFYHNSLCLVPSTKP